MESAHPFSVSFAPCCQAILCRSQLFFRMFLDKLFQICADRFIMKQKRRCFSPFLLSPSSRRAWIEILCPPLARATLRRSPSSRRAWIEIVDKGVLCWVWIVALLAEGVDRNHQERLQRVLYPVALLAEGVDRNCRWYLLPQGGAGVALLAEGVDRNCLMVLHRTSQAVALLAEGVDRNRLSVTALLWSSSRPPRGGRG